MESSPLYQLIIADPFKKCFFWGRPPGPPASYAPGNEDAGRLPKHDKYDFLPYVPTMIAQDHIPEPVLAGKRDQQPISREHACELLGQGAIQRCIRFVRANTLAEGQIRHDPRHTGSIQR